MIFYLLSIITALIAIFITYLKWTYGYWARKNIPYIEPTIPFGNVENNYTRKHYIGEQISKLYNILKKKGKGHGGIYIMTNPYYMPIDLEFLKNIMTKDFSNFHERGVYYNERDDPLSAHLFNVGGSKWRKLRTKLTPTFTSGKMKLMFSTVVECAKLFEQNMKNNKKLDIDIKEALGRFTTDIIGSCAFGLECNAMNEEESEFRKHGRLIFKRNKFLSPIKQFLMQFPEFAKTIGITSFRKDTTEFFIKVVKDTLEYRKNNSISRSDFLQLLINIKESSGDSTLTLEEIAAQCFVFFIAGFETSSTAMTFALYEMAANQDIQNKARDEINKVLAKHNGEITYDSLAEMKYLEQVINESLRLYSPLPFLTRVASEDYKMPGTDFILEKGTKIMIPIHAIHHDEEHYPEPKKFDPKRFTEENIANRHQYAFLAFGEGPRICIGSRFGMMQSKIGLLVLLKNFKFTVSDKTKQPMKIARHAFIPTADGDIWLNAQSL